MKNVILTLGLFAFLGTAAVAQTTTAKDDKSKAKTEECQKSCSKTCAKGEKAEASQTGDRAAGNAGTAEGKTETKACCAKGETKACCAKGETKADASQTGDRAAGNAGTAEEKTEAKSCCAKGETKADASQTGDRAAGNAGGAETKECAKSCCSKSKAASSEKGEVKSETKSKSVASTQRKPVRQNTNTGIVKVGQK
jgi:NADH-quinone oxidoreductase subunit C